MTTTSPPRLSGRKAQAARNDETIVSAAREVFLAGETIERIFPDRLEEQAYLLAYHFEQGGSLQRALHYYRLAAEAAARVFANAEAAENYRHAIELAGELDLDLADLSGMILRRGRILEEGARFKEAIENYQELENLARDRGDRAVGCRQGQAVLQQCATHPEFARSCYARSTQRRIVSHRCWRS